MFTEQWSTTYQEQKEFIREFLSFVEDIDDRTYPVSFISDTEPTQTQLENTWKNSRGDKEPIHSSKVYWYDSINGAIEQVYLAVAPDIMLFDTLFQELQKIHSSPFVYIGSDITEADVNTEVIFSADTYLGLWAVFAGRGETTTANRSLSANFYAGSETVYGLCSQLFLGDMSSSDSSSRSSNNALNTRHYLAFNSLPDANEAIWATSSGFFFSPLYNKEKYESYHRFNFCRSVSWENSDQIVHFRGNMVDDGTVVTPIDRMIIYDCCAERELSEPSYLHVFGFTE